MRPDERDPGYVWDMLDAARSIRDFTRGVTQDQYLKDRKVQLAVERALEIIGEAARLVSTEFKKLHPDIPWQQIIGQRNVIAHDYGEIKQDRIWKVATDRIPDLVGQLERLLPPAPRE
jgi:uncharacterized protein with HEPN domain